MMGARRRRSMRGGMGYGMNGTIGTAGALYSPSWGGEVTKSGQPVFDSADPQRGSGRRKGKKSKKVSKKSMRKSRRTTRRKVMRGGAQWQSIAGTRAEYHGSGERGLINVSAGTSKVPPAGAHSQNPDGAMHV
jgi:hypothetical protein